MSSTEDIRHAAGIYHEDLMHIERQLQEKPQDNTPAGFWQRSYVRTFVSFVESATAFLQEIILDYRKSEKIELAPELLLALNGQSINIADNGRLKTPDIRVRLIGKVKFTFKMLNEICHYTTKIDTQADWENLVKVIGFRDRITHPRNVTQQNFTEEEMALCISTSDWFYINAADFIDQDADYQKKKTAELEEKIRELQKKKQLDKSPNKLLGLVQNYEKTD